MQAYEILIAFDPGLSKARGDIWPERPDLCFSKFVNCTFSLYVVVSMPSKTYFSDISHSLLLQEAEVSCESVHFSLARLANASP